MTSKPPDTGTNDNISKLSETFKAWLVPTSALAVALATILSALFGTADRSAQIIGYAVAIVLTVAGIFIYKRVKSKQRAGAQRKEQQELWAQNKKRTAFRGLSPYGEKDVLPGAQRKREARMLVVQITDPAFSFMIVCGDSGCGKTSLLRSEVQVGLREEGKTSQPGFRVLYITNPREFASDPKAAKEGADAGLSSKLERELDAFQKAIASAQEGLPLILIVDQFEEYFIEYTQITDRARIGHFLHDHIHASPPVHILCAIRRDYLVDMKDLALPEQISLNTVFQLKNFTLEEATEIISECADHDGITPDEEFAPTLAADLVEGGFVRPPELQIVCTALAGNLTLTEYRLSGGAKGILSHHIEKAVTFCSDPDLGRRILRALCDFPAHAKKNPQTMSMLRDAVGSVPNSGKTADKADGPTPTPARSPVSDPIQGILDQFEAARLIVSEERRGEETKYALIHDYLVDAVAMATADVSTRVEEANQMLEYYRAEYLKDSKTRIPFRRRKFIKTYADKRVLANPLAKKLMTASLISQVLIVAGFLAAVIVTTGVLYGIITTRHYWKQSVVGSHWEQNVSGKIGLGVSPEADYIFTGLGYSSKGYVRQWKTKNAEVSDSVESNAAYLTPKANYLFVLDPLDTKVKAIHIPTKKEYPTPLHPLDISPTASGIPFNIAFNEREDVLAYQRSEGFNIWSLTEQKYMATISGCGEAEVVGEWVTNNADFIVLCKEEKRDPAFEVKIFPVFWNTRTRERKELVQRQNSVSGLLAINEEKSLIATIENLSDGQGLSDEQCIVDLWDIRTASHLRSSQLIPTGQDLYAGLAVIFSPTGDYLLVQNEFKEVLAVLKSSDLQSVLPSTASEVQNLSFNPPYQREQHLYLGWMSNTMDATIWKLGQREPQIVKNLNLPSLRTEYEETTDILKIHRDGVYAFIHRKKNNQIELWDFDKGEKIRELDVEGRIVDADYTADNHAIEVQIEGGMTSLYRIDTGEKIMDLQYMGGAKQAIFFDPACRLVHVWTDEGRVLRYTEGRGIFNSDRLFWPTGKCKLN